MPISIIIYDLLPIITHLFFYLVCIISSLIAFFAFKQTRNLGYILIIMFFMLDIYGYSRTIINNYKNGSNIAVKYQAGSKITTKVNNIRFPLGELLLMMSLWFLTKGIAENKKAIPAKGIQQGQADGQRTWAEKG